jgi:CheY-like chemotaxis protein
LAKILAVDDDPLILGVLKVLIESQGHTIMTAPDGPKALELIRGSKPDLVMSDIRMNPMNGIELLREIRKEWRDLPVIMITAFASAETKDESRKLGTVAYLAKPFTNEEVVGAVRNALAPPPCGRPAMEQLVHEYMSREHIPNLLEAKGALADELYWLSQDHPAETLLAALNEAMGKQDIPVECVNKLLKYRETVVHVKKVIGASAETKGVDPANLLQEISGTIADARARHKTDDAIIAFVCGLLAIDRGSLTPEDLEFFNEYYSCSKPPESAKTEVAPKAPVQEPPKPAPAQKAPQPVRERDLLKDAIAGNMAGFTDDDIRNLVQKLRADRILKADDLAIMGKHVTKALRGRTDDASKELKRTVKDHLSLTDVKSFYSTAELATLETLKVSTDEIQKALETLNGMSGHDDVILGLKKLIAESAQQKLMSKFGIRYCKKRYAVAYGSRKSEPSSDA